MLLRLRVSGNLGRGMDHALAELAREIRMATRQFQRSSSGRRLRRRRWGVSLAMILAPLPLLLLLAGPTRADHPIAKLIDGEIAATLAARSVVPSPPAAKQELHRRLYLDLLGRIPTAAESRAYLDDMRVDKHVALVDRLLAHEELPAHWRLVFDAWLNGDLAGRDFGRDRFLDYLEESLRTNKPWNRLARELIVPDLNDKRLRPAAYFLAMRVRGGDNEARLDALTSGVASMFFGVQLQCAKCHDHPFVDSWKQDHYYGLAAFLGRLQEARIDNLPIVKERADGEVKFVTKQQENKTARLMFLDSRVFDEPPPPSDRGQLYVKAENGLPETPAFSRRTVLADYALTTDSTFFKRAIVNRIWKQLMGRGLVEPVDQMHLANPASHPQLLERLADDFAASGFDLRRLMAGILHSDAYQRSSRWTTAAPRPADSLYAAAIIKPLTADQLTVSVSLATGQFERLRAKWLREAKDRPSGGSEMAWVRGQYARDRDMQEFAARFRQTGDSFEAHAGQALFLSFNPLMRKQLEPLAGSLVERLVKQADNRLAVEDAFLSILSRQPTEDERLRAAEYLTSDKGQRADRCRDLAWALLCGSEFRFNH